MSINWQDLMQQAGGIDFTPIPKGDYVLEAQQADAKMASTGKGMIKVKFVVSEGPYKGRTIWHNFVLSPDNPNALVFFFRHMAAFGLQKDFFQMQPSLETIAGQLVNKRVLANVDDSRIYQGERQNDVKSVRSLGGPALQAGGPVPAGAPAVVQGPVTPQPPQAPAVPQVPAAPAAPVAPPAAPAAEAPPTVPAPPADLDEDPV